MIVPQDSRYVIERSGLLTPVELEITSTIGARKIVSNFHSLIESVVPAFRRAHHQPRHVTDHLLNCLHPSIILLES